MNANKTKPECTVGDGLRSNLYSLLATLLAGPPSGPILARLRGIDDHPEAHGHMAAAWRSMKAAADLATPFEVENEYQALFVGLGKGELVPYASWYLTGRIMAEPLARLRTDLMMLGIHRQRTVYEAEDHAAPLCETMALISSPPKSVTLETQQHFFNHHISVWMHKFFRDMQKAPSARFYRAVGTLGEAFLSVEMQYLNL